MKILEINAVPYGSTGEIMFQIADLCEQNGNEARCAVGYTRKSKKHRQYVTVSGLLTKLHHIIKSMFTGKVGEYSFFATNNFLKKIDKFKPDIIHLHNLHNHFINLPLLFDYVRKNNIKVIWTLHDCWPFTGKCPYFTMVKCDKWKNGCYECLQVKDYPKAYIDRTKYMWGKKKEWFNGVKDLTIVTPSLWLANLVKQSFLKEYPVKVINNGIDLSIFKPTENSFKEKYNIQDKYMALGVAFDWGKRKGLDVFIELSKKLDKKYQIVLVGTNEKVDKELPKNIISIHRTQNQTELAEIYTASDVFVNPTREDNYPTVNMESLACGTPVITFKTGGSPEMLDETCGIVVDCDDTDALLNGIKEVCENKKIERETCTRWASTFDMNERFNEYLDLYKIVSQK